MYHNIGRIMIIWHIIKQYRPVVSDIGLMEFGPLDETCSV